MLINRYVKMVTQSKIYKHENKNKTKTMHIKISQYLSVNGTIRR